MLVMISHNFGLVRQAVRRSMNCITTTLGFYTPSLSVICYVWYLGCLCICTGIYNGASEAILWMPAAIKPSRRRVRTRTRTATATTKTLNEMNKTTGHPEPRSQWLCLLRGGFTFAAACSWGEMMYPEKTSFFIIC